MACRGASTHMYNTRPTTTTTTTHAISYRRALVVVAVQRHPVAQGGQQRIDDVVLLGGPWFIHGPANASVGIRPNSNRDVATASKLPATI